VDVVGADVLKEFARKHKNACPSLDRWLGLTRASSWKTFQDVKATFPATDYIPKNQFCFDIGGNKYRLLSTISFSIGVVSILEIMTHAEYDKRKLKTR
jgi:mRNA interferase HigB